MENLQGVSSDRLAAMLAALQAAYGQIAPYTPLTSLYNLLWSAAASVEAEMVLRAEMGL